MNNDQYWATLPPKELAPELLRRTQDYFLRVTNNGLWSLWAASYSYYYASVGTSIQAAGALSNPYLATGSFLQVNHYRSLAESLLNLVVSSRPAFEPRAVNTDHKSQTQSLLARGLLDYYLREQNVEQYLREAVQFALMYGEGYLCVEWDPEAGEPFARDPETGKLHRTGDLTFYTATPLDVVRDLQVSDPEKVQWRIVRRLKNRWDLAARYPELADQLKSYTSPSGDLGGYMSFYRTLQDANPDLVLTYTLYHDRTAALPEGRQVEVLDDELVLFDGPLPYATNPLKVMLPTKLSYTPFGFTPLYDLMPLQDSVNGLYSTIKTNQETFGVQNVLVPKGSGLGVSELAGGLNQIEYDANLGKPEALNLTETPAEIFNFLEKVERAMETLSGVNSVVRGDPQASLKSGAALALVQSQAIQFSYALQFAYTRLLEDTGQAMIDTLRTFASEKRIAAIVGVNGQAELTEFSGDDLTLVNRVLVDQGNPLSRTTAGKLQLAELLLQNKLVDDPQQLLQVIQTGNLEPLTEGPTTELIAIKQENEALSSGRPVIALVTDNHQQHLTEHKAVLSDPALRDPSNPKAQQLIQNALDHLSQHVRLASDPNNALILSMLGQQPVSAAPVPGAGQVVTPPGADRPELPKQPNMPINPLTGQQAQKPNNPGQA